MRTRNRKNLRRDRLKQYLKAKYGMKYEKGGKTGEGNPPEADFLLKRDPLADYDRETVGVAEGARGIGTLGTTTASDQARRQMSFLVPPESMEPLSEEVPEERQRGEDMAPMPTRGPRVIRRGQERDIMQGGSGIPVSTAPTPEIQYAGGDTSNVRMHGSGRLYGEDYKNEKVPIGFKDGSGFHYGKPALFKKLREEGIAARGQLTEDTIRELYETNPELFMDGPAGEERARLFIGNEILNEAKQGFASSKKRYAGRDVPPDEFYYINNQ